MVMFKDKQESAKIIFGTFLSHTPALWCKQIINRNVSTLFLSALSHWQKNSDFIGDSILSFDLFTTQVLDS
jgi:hypothetical protein